MTRLRSLAPLTSSLVGASLSRTGDRSRVLHDWLRQQLSEANVDNIVLNLGVKKVLLVAGQDLSRYLLAQSPDSEGVAAGKLKTSAMSFLAPRALTISNDDAWRDRRAYNESVLCTGQPHSMREAFLDHVNRAFSAPVRTAGEIHDRMGQVMLGVVFGGHAPSGLVREVDALISIVESPPKRILLGWRHRRRRRRFYDALLQQWTAAPSPCLAASGRRMGRSDVDETIEQVPHWMFTFTGSGTTLLTRTLGIVGSRPEVRKRVIDEIATAGSLDDADTIERLGYLEACLRETGRLYPPVTRTFHVAPQGDDFDGWSIPARMEIVHYFPLQNRNENTIPNANEFRPERWTDDTSDELRLHANLFLGGARRCPGEDLILYICKAALAQLLATHDLHVEIPALMGDPLPLFYPKPATGNAR